MAQNRSRQSKKSRDTPTARRLNVVLVVESLVWAVSVPLMFAIVIIVGLVQQTIPSSQEAGRNFLYAAAPGYPAFALPLALYIVLALISLAFSVVVGFPRLRSGFLQPWFLIAQNIVFGLGDYWVSSTFHGAPGWPEQAWIASIIRVVALVILIIVLIRDRSAKS